MELIAPPPNEVYLHPPRSNTLQRFKFSPDEVVQLPYTNSVEEEKFLATSYFDHGYIDFPRDYWGDIGVETAARGKGWFKISEVLPRALFRMHHDHWRIRFGKALKREADQIKTREPRLKHIIETSKVANTMLRRQTDAMLGADCYFPKEQEKFEEVLFNCSNIRKSNVKVEVLIRGVVERSGIFLYGLDGKHKIMTPEEKQTGDYSDDFKSFAYPYTAYKTGSYIVEQEVEGDEEERDGKERDGKEGDGEEGDGEGDGEFEEVPRLV